MSEDRLVGLLAAYFNQPYPEYREVILEIRNRGGLDSDECQFLLSNVSLVDANAIIRHSGTTESAVIAARPDRHT